MGILRFASALLSVSLLAAGLAGCGHAHRKGNRENPPIAIGPRDILFVALPTVPDSVDSLLGRTGWGGGRFSRELQKEILFQLNRKGMATVEDSAQAKAALLVAIRGYVQGTGATSRFEGSALLRTAAGERVIDFKKLPARGEAPERQDPTVDNLRRIASTLVEEAGRDPVAKKAPNQEYVPNMIMLF